MAAMYERQSRLTAPATRTSDRVFCSLDNGAWGGWSGGGTAKHGNLFFHATSPVDYQQAAFIRVIR